MLARQGGEALKDSRGECGSRRPDETAAPGMERQPGNNRRTRQATGECASIATQPGTAARVPTKQDRDSRQHADRQRFGRASDETSTHSSPLKGKTRGRCARQQMDEPPVRDRREMSNCAVSLSGDCPIFQRLRSVGKSSGKEFPNCFGKRFPKGACPRKETSVPAISNRMRLGFSSFRSSERARIKSANNPAAFHRAAIGRSTRFFVEQPGERASSGFLTHLRRGKCHTHSCFFFTTPGSFKWCREGTT